MLGAHGGPAVIAVVNTLSPYRPAVEKSAFKFVPDAASDALNCESMFKEFSTTVVENVDNLLLIYCN